MWRKAFISCMIALLAAVPLIGIGPEAAHAATDSRSATIKELSGDVKVQLAGGSSEIQAYANLSLRQGDTLTTGDHGYVTLAFASGGTEDDTITAAPNTSLTLSKLSGQGTAVTVVSVLNGSVWSDVRSVNDPNGRFRIETPTAALSAGGTHFLVSIDPITGYSTTYVLAGIVNAAPRLGNSSAGGAGVLLFPAMQILLNGHEQGPDLRNGIAYLDPAAMIASASPSIVGAMLSSLSQIEQENEAMMQDTAKKRQIQSTALGQSPTEGTDPVQYQHNLGILADVLAKAALGQKDLLAKKEPSQLEAMTRQLQELLNAGSGHASSNEQDIPDSLQMTQDQLAKQRTLAELLAQAQRQAIEQRQRQQQNLSSLLNSILSQMQSLGALNQSLQNDRNEQALQAYLGKLTPEERQKFLAARQQLLGETPQTPVTAPSGPQAPSGPSAPSDPSTPTDPSDPSEPTEPSNRAPTDLSLSLTSFEGELAAGATIGTLTATDPDEGDTFAFSFAAEGDGGADNGKFAIEGSVLKAKEAIPEGTYRVSVRVTDAGGLSFQKAFTIAVMSQGPEQTNHAPTDIAFSPADGLGGGAASGTPVGTLSAVDPDGEDSFAYRLVADEANDRHDNDKFTISGNELLAADDLGIGAYTVVVEATDAGGLTVQKAISFSLLPEGVEKWDTQVDGVSVNWLFNGETSDGDEQILNYALFLDAMPAQSFRVDYRFGGGIASAGLETAQFSTPLDPEGGSIDYPIGLLNESDNNADVTYDLGNGKTIRIHLIVYIGKPDLYEVGLMANNDGSMTYPILNPTGPNTFSAYVPDIGSTLEAEAYSDWGDAEVTSANPSEGGPSFELEEGWNTFEIDIYYPGTRRLSAHYTLNVLEGTPAAGLPGLSGISGTDIGGNEGALNARQSEDDPLSWSGYVGGNTPYVDIAPEAANGDVAAVYYPGDGPYEVKQAVKTADGKYRVPFSYGQAYVFVAVKDASGQLLSSTLSISQFNPELGLNVYSSVLDATYPVDQIGNDLWVQVPQEAEGLSLYTNSGYTVKIGDVPLDEVQLNPSSGNNEYAVTASNPYAGADASAAYTLHLLYGDFGDLGLNSILLEDGNIPLAGSGNGFAATVPAGTTAVHLTLGLAEGSTAQVLDPYGLSLGTGNAFELPLQPPTDESDSISFGIVVTDGSGNRRLYPLTIYAGSPID